MDIIFEQQEDILQFAMDSLEMYNNCRMFRTVNRRATLCAQKLLGRVQEEFAGGVETIISRAGELRVAFGSCVNSPVDDQAECLVGLFNDVIEIGSNYIADVLASRDDIIRRGLALLDEYHTCRWEL